jgi:hypothetical protein
MLGEGIARGQRVSVAKSSKKRRFVPTAHVDPFLGPLSAASSLHLLPSTLLRKAYTIACKSSSFVKVRVPWLPRLTKEMWVMFRLFLAEVTAGCIVGVHRPICYIPQPRNSARQVRHRLTQSWASEVGVGRAGCSFPLCELAPCWVHDRMRGRVGRN